MRIQRYNLLLRAGELDFPQSGTTTTLNSMNFTADEIQVLMFLLVFFLDKSR